LNQLLTVVRLPGISSYQPEIPNHARINEGRHAYDEFLGPL